MTQVTTRQRLTFEEYIDFCQTTDERYELVRGELVRMTPPTWMHIRIAKFLEKFLDSTCERLGFPWEAFRDSGQRTESGSSRLPDVIVAPTEVIAPLVNQTAVLEVPAPIVIEIVSPSSANQDYNEKLQEYLRLGILEYWVVDHDALGAASHIGFPKRPTLTIYHLIEGEYQGQAFRGSELLNSPTLGELTLTAEQVFSAGQ